MSKTKKTIAKGGIATVTLGAMALAGATPAYASHRDRNGIDAGDVIAGALIIGGIAAVASAASKDGYRDGYRYRQNGHGHGNSRMAIERCVRAVERDARRAGFRYADVTEIRDVDRERRGWEVRGRLVVDDRYRGGYRSRAFDRGAFKCEIRRGRIVEIDYRGIRGLG